MTSFGWKRKCNILNAPDSEFTSSIDKYDDYDLDPSIDLLTTNKIKKVSLVEESVAKVKKLSDEGSILAQNECWWDAIRKFRCALAIDSQKYIIRDMLAQCLLQIDEVFSAVQTAKGVISSNPLWWPGHQTLGRAYLNLGEVDLAVKSFSRALHLNPDNKELWKEDLKWAECLRQKHRDLQEEEKIKKLKEDAENSFILEEVPSDFDEKNGFDNIIIEKAGLDVRKYRFASKDKASTSKRERFSRPITCTSKRPKDSRFVKPVATLNQEGSVSLASREKVKLGEMICFRS